MKTAKNQKKIVSISLRLTRDQHQVLKRLCALKKTTQTAYLADLATSKASQELLRHAVEEYVSGHASLSELSTKTGLDVTTIMEAVSQAAGEDQKATETFLEAAKSLSKIHNDPEFYDLAVKAMTK